MSEGGGRDRDMSFVVFEGKYSGKHGLGAPLVLRLRRSSGEMIGMIVIQL